MPTERLVTRPGPRYLMRGRNGETEIIQFQIVERDEDSKFATSHSQTAGTGSSPCPVSAGSSPVEGGG